MTVERSNIRLIDPEELEKKSESVPVETPIPEVNTWVIDDLPSRSVFYNGKTLIGRPLTVLEVKKITSITADNVDEIIDGVLKSAVSGIDINDICVGDKLYILYWLRAQTFINDGFRVPYTCDICEKQSTYHFTVANMEQNYLNPEFNMSWLTFTNPLDNKIISYYPRTINDENKARYFFGKMSKSIPLDIDLLNIAIQIKTIDNNPVNLTEAYNYLLKDSQNFSILASYMSRTEFSISPYFTITCDECGEHGHTAISFRPEFLFPTYRV